MGGKSECERKKRKEIAPIPGRDFWQCYGKIFINFSQVFLITGFRKTNTANAESIFDQSESDNQILQW